jgi:Sugar-specific transcriptional regulator TrmB.
MDYDDKKRELIERDLGTFRKKSFKQVQEELKKLRETKEFKNEYVRRILKEKPELRKTFAAVMVNNPARKQDIKEYTFVSNPTIYHHLYKLLELKLVEVVKIMKLWNKKKLNPEDQEVMNKFKEWTEHMSEGQINQFAARTHYWRLTELGRDAKIINWVLRLEELEKDGEEV